MKASLLLPTLSIALMLTAPAFAETTANAQSNQATANSQSQNHEKNVLTINKLKQDLEKAGFKDVKIFQDSFVVQATDKDGNPTVMSLSPSGVFAISEIGQQSQGNASHPMAGASSESTNTHGRTARAGHAMNGPGQSSGPAEGTDVAPAQGRGASGEPGTPGFPGNKNGPAVTPPNQH